MGIGYVNENLFKNYESRFQNPALPTGVITDNNSDISSANFVRQASSTRLCSHINM